MWSFNGVGDLIQNYSPFSDQVCLGFLGIKEDFYESSGSIIFCSKGIYFNNVKLINLAEFIEEGGVSFIEAFPLDVGNEDKSTLLSFMA